MKWTRSELMQGESQNVTFDDSTEISDDAFDACSRINGVSNVNVTGHGFLEPETDMFYVEMHITGVMRLPDAVTGEEIQHPFETDAEEVYSFGEPAEGTDEDSIIRVVNDEVIDLKPAVIDAIMLEVPMQLTEASPEDYPHGDGWEVITEGEFEKRRRESGPRLGDFMDFKQN